MQSTFSVAAMILASAAMVVAILGIGACETPSDGVKTRIGTTNAVYVADWSVPDRWQHNVGFGLPRLPRPRLPRPSLPRQGW